jgi:hypothetical protein
MGHRSGSVLIARVALRGIFFALKDRAAMVIVCSFKFTSVSTLSAKSSPARAPVPAASANNARFNCVFAAFTMLGPRDPDSELDGLRFRIERPYLTSADIGVAK